MITQYEKRKEYLKAYSKHYYHNNPEQKEKRKLRERKRAEKNRKIFKEWKATLECKLCAEKESCCLDFHHLNPDEKDFEIGVIQSKNLDYVQKEASKCIVLCSNCHRKVHAGIIQLVE